MIVEKLKIRQVIVVEGRYDKIKLDSLLDATIITTDGFGIFKDKEKQALLRTLADRVGLISCTDSDGAGLVIRNFLSGIIPKNRLTHVLIPPIKGVERRKLAPSKEGTLGVEGIEADILRALFEPLSSGYDNPAPTDQIVQITNGDLYDNGLIGAKNSKEKRTALMRALRLPVNLSTSTLIQAINLLGGRKVYENALEEIENNAKNSSPNV